MLWLVGMESIGHLAEKISAISDVVNKMDSREDSIRQLQKITLTIMTNMSTIEKFPLEVKAPTQEIFAILNNNIAQATELMCEFNALPCDVPLFNLKVMKQFKISRSLFDRKWKEEISAVLEKLKEIHAGTLGISLSLPICVIHK